MADVLSFKQFDTLRPLQLQLLRRDGVPQNLAGATVSLFMRTPTSATPTLNVAMSILDPINGVVEYQWADGDLDEPGEYWYEVQVTASNGKRATFPSKGYDRLIVYDDIA